MLSNTPAGARDRLGRALTFLIATLVHLPALVLLIAAVLLLRSQWLDAPAMVTAGALLLLALVMRPRLGAVPRRWPVVTRSDAPSLFGLLDEVTRSLKASTPIHWVAFDLRYNCSTQLVGLRRRRLIVIGLPLWEVLTVPERVAMLAHEVAHDTNHDLTDTLVVGSALQILGSLSDFLKPPRRYSRSGGSAFAALTALGEWVANLVIRTLGKLTYLVFLLLLKSSRPISPRAEYLADRQAAAVSSPKAAVRSLDRLCLARPAMQYLAMSRDREDDVWRVFRSNMSAFPAKEHERLRRLGRRSGHQVDDTHPPTDLRIELLRQLPDTTPAVIASAEQVESIERELALVELRLAQMIAGRRQAAV